MTRKKTSTIIVQNKEINITFTDQNDYINLTDMAKAKTDSSRASDVIRNWLRTRMTLEFLGTWETLYNPDFKVFEYEHFKSEVGLHTFTPSISEWIEKTDAIGVYVQKGRYGGTYAHKDIAFEFGSAISPVFKLYLIKEYQRLKDEENSAHKIEWDTKHIFEEGELVKSVVVRKFRATTQHGAVSGKTQSHLVEHYNLDVIISVGYRVTSLRGTQFRIWATSALRRLKNLLILVNGDAAKSAIVVTETLPYTGGRWLHC
ncbi:MAG: KilA-N domain-containing protein [Clostridiales Family XIII bacterium]|jgi:hypothetical protein|nr:KilA-N domain-containing protein [Clostridiales Family XIII bacterium]